MLKIKLITLLLFTSKWILAQNEHEVVQFSNTLNQFLNVRDFCIAQNGNEAFFTIQSPSQEISQIAYITKENNEWTTPELLAFSDSYMYLEPFLSIDGKRLYFVSDRPLNDATHTKKDFDIWYVERNSKGEKWSEPKNIGTQVNSTLNEFYPSVSENNNLYFTMESPDGLGKDDIYFCRWENGNYLNPILLDENINSTGYEFNAFVSKKEDYIIFTKYNEKDGYGSGDLYISKKDASGKWEIAKNIGVPINTKYMEYCPFYDEKTQTLYFTSKRNDVTPREFNNILEFQKYINEGNNGLSKIYMTLLKIE